MATIKTEMCSNFEWGILRDLLQKFYRNLDLKVVFVICRRATLLRLSRYGLWTINLVRETQLNSILIMPSSVPPRLLAPKYATSSLEPPSFLISNQSKRDSVADGESQRSALFTFPALSPVREAERVRKSRRHHLFAIGGVGTRASSNTLSDPLQFARSLVVSDWRESRDNWESGRDHHLFAPEVQLFSFSLSLAVGLPSHWLLHYSIYFTLFSKQLPSSCCVCVITGPCVYVISHRSTFVSQPKTVRKNCPSSTVNTPFIPSVPLKKPNMWLSVSFSLDFVRFHHDFAPDPRFWLSAE